MTTEKTDERAENPQETVIRMRKELTNFAISGNAVSFRGIIVSDTVWQELQRQNMGKVSDTYMVMGTEGHRSLKYNFYIQADPSLPIEYTFVHHTKDAYNQKFLGRVDTVMKEFHDKPRRRASFGRSVVVQELNPFIGVTEVKHGFNGASYYNNVDFDDVVDAIQKGLQTSKGIQDSLDERFGSIYESVVNNPPEAKWTGRIEFHQDGNRKSVDLSTRVENEFIFHPDMIFDKRCIGRMYIQSDRSFTDVLVDGGKTGPFRIVGIMKDGFGVNHPYVLPGSEQTDPMEFAKFAIKHFLPEEIFVGTGGMHKSELEAIQALPVRESWGVHYSHEDVGRIEDSWNGYEDHPEYYFSVRLEDSRANAWNFDLAKAKGKEEGDKLKAKYFPEGWTGWPETETPLDRALAIFAAGL